MGTRGSRQRTGSEPLFEARVGYRHCWENKLCRECGKKVSGRRTRWCSDECVDAYLVRSDPNHARKKVFQRDRGVCASCGRDCLALKKEVEALDRATMALWWERTGRTGKPPLRPKVVSGHQGYLIGIVKESGPALEEARRGFLNPLGMESWWWRKSFWDVDHVVEVRRGGGDCGLDNLQTLCLGCHAKKSAEDAARRARSKRITKIPRRDVEKCSGRGQCSKRRPCRGCRRYRARVLGDGVPHSDMGSVG